MRYLFLTFLFASATSVAMAQEAPANLRGSNPDPQAPVNVANPADRPANPEVKSAVPAKGGAVFHVKNDKPVQDNRPVVIPSMPAGSRFTPAPTEQKKTR